MRISSARCAERWAGERNRSTGSAVGEIESPRSRGDVWALTVLWKSLGFSGLRRVFRRTRHTTDEEALIRLMVLNRLCDPESKLGVLH